MKILKIHTHITHMMLTYEYSKLLGNGLEEGGQSHYQFRREPVV
jgi:hypothetical protein